MPRNPQSHQSAADGTVIPEGETIELSNHQYFSHIDGLRALAIIPVVIYHIASSWCPGGFAGVDVFFVISGFLITRNITAALQNGQFSFRDFYYRRIKRIMPAYFAVILAVLIIFPFITTFTNYKAIASSGLYSVFYSANIYFLNHNGYFDFNNRQNPLLHLWSLGVEEQFYLAAPICLWVLWKHLKKWFLTALITMLAASCIFSIVEVNSGGSQVAFYMLPTRAWELLAGAVISQVIFKKKIHRIAGEVFSWLGLVLVLLPYILYTENTPFPGAAAIPSIIGSSLLILFGGQGLIQGLLSSKPAVFVGKTSYSAYLWHWPIILLGYEFFASYFALWSLAAIISVTYLSYRFIERPIRKSKTFTPRRAFALLIFGTLIIASACYVISSKPSKLIGAPLSWRGIVTWKSFVDIRNRDSIACDINALESGAPLIKIGAPESSPSFILWGDSHALCLLCAADTVAVENGKAGYFINRQHNLVSKGTEQARARESVLQWLEGRKDISDIFLVNYWFIHLKNQNDVNTIINICERLSRAGKHVFFFVNVPQANQEALRRFEWGLTVSREIGSMSLQDYERSARWQKQLIDELTQRGIATVIPIDRAFFDGTAYRTVSTDRSYYSDNNHLTQEGADRAMKFVSPLIWKQQ